MSGAASLTQFVADPGAWADPSLVAPRIAPGLLPQTASRLMSAERTGQRASTLLASHLGAPTPPLTEADQNLAIAPPARLAAIARAAGAVRHASRVRALVRGADIAALAARIGPDARAAALHHAPAQPLPASTVTDDLAADIETDGAACIAAWLADLPAWAAARVRLAHSWPTEPAGPTLAAPSATPAAAPTAALAALVRQIAAAAP